MRLGTRTAALAVTALAAIGASGKVGMSAAAFTASSTSRASISAKADWVAPALTFTSPGGGAYVNTRTPALTGAAGTAAGDAASVAVSLWTGSAATGTPLQTPAATIASGAWTAVPALLAEGTYTARATQSDNAQNTTTTPAHTFTVDVTAPQATGIQAANGGANAGVLEPQDRVTFTFSEPMSAASILAGWTGTAAAAVKVVVTDAGGKDQLVVHDSGGGLGVALGTVDLAANHVTGNVTFDATMALSGSSIVVTLGAATPAANLRGKSVAAKALVWTPLAGPTDRAGNPLSLTPATVTATSGF